MHKNSAIFIHHQQKAHIAYTARAQHQHTTKDPTKRNKEVHNIYFDLNIFYVVSMKQKWKIVRIYCIICELLSSSLNSYNSKTKKRKLLQIFRLVRISPWKLK